MMSVTFTRHALIRIQQRGFFERDILKVLNEAEITAVENEYENNI